jgi:hypothetical protein
MDQTNKTNKQTNFISRTAVLFVSLSCAASSSSLTMLHLLKATLALTSVVYVAAASTGQLPSSINLTYPGEEVDIRQEYIQLSFSFPDEKNIDDAATSIYDVGVLLPNGTTFYSHTEPSGQLQCEKRLLAAGFEIPGPFPLNGTYVAPIYTHAHMYSTSFLRPGTPHIGISPTISYPLLLKKAIYPLTNLPVVRALTRPYRRTLLQHLKLAVSQPILRKSPVRPV